MITRSWSVEIGATSAVTVTPAFCLGRRSATGPVQICIEIAGGLGGKAGDRLELLARRVEHRIRRAEVRQQRALALGPDARQPVEHGLRHLAVAALAVVGDREAVRLV